MGSGFWKSVPAEYIEKWREIFSDNQEGCNLSICCPICKEKGLHRYYQTARRVEKKENDIHRVKGAEWQWCSFCRCFEHGQVSVPDWWDSRIEIDGNKLMAIPEILEMAYQDFEKVDKWKSVPEHDLDLWNEIFSQNQNESILKVNCPICNENKLRQYYTINIPKQTKYKKQVYKGMGAHWEWCANCFHYKFNNMAYVPLEWSCELNIESWKLMAIPEPINDKMNKAGE